MVASSRGSAEQRRSPGEEYEDLERRVTHDGAFGRKKGYVMEVGRGRQGGRGEEREVKRGKGLGRDEVG